MLVCVKNKNIKIASMYLVIGIIYITVQLFKKL